MGEEVSSSAAEIAASPFKGAETDPTTQAAPAAAAMTEGSDSNGSSAGPDKDENHIRIKIRYKGQCTLLGFDRKNPLTVREIVAKTCTRMHIKGPVSDYALFVNHGKTNIRVFESSDLKDDDVCELVQIELESDSDEDEDELLDSDDDDDKTVPMSAEKPTQPESLPPQEKPKAVPITKETKKEYPIRSSLRGALKESMASTEWSPIATTPPKRKLASRGSTSNRRKAPRLSKAPKALIPITKRNQRDLEPDTHIIFERFSDGHFHEAIFKKYLPPEKQSKEPHTCWVFAHIIDYDLPESKWPPSWVDLNSFRSFILDPDDVITAKKQMRGASSLGKRLRVKWKDGNYYDGVVTRTLSSDKNFVYIEYDDGDQCWSSLGEELDAFELSDDSPGAKKKKNENNKKKNGKRPSRRKEETKGDSSGDEEGFTIEFAH